MLRKERTKQIDHLKRTGFRMVKGCQSLYINESGAVYSLNTNIFLIPDSKNNVRTENKRLSVPRLILEAFKGEPYRTGQIVYIDSNKANMTLNNIKYSRLFAPDQYNEVNEADLIKAIRCYIKVESSYRIKNSFNTFEYLNLITDKRYFLQSNSKTQNINIFRSYLKSNISKTANEHGLTIRDCTIIVNGFKNVLISDILNDLENGKLRVLDYKPRPKRKLTDRQAFADWLKEMGFRTR